MCEKCEAWVRARRDPFWKPKPIPRAVSPWYKSLAPFRRW